MTWIRNRRTNHTVGRMTPRKRAVQLALGLVAIVVAGRSALALEVVLVDRTSRATVAMADYPGDKSGNTVIVAWDNAPGDPPAGAMVFRRERHGSSTSYAAIGGGPILVVDRGRQCAALLARRRRRAARGLQGARRGARRDRLGARRSTRSNAPI